MHFAGSNLSTDPKTAQKCRNASTKFRKTSESKKAEKSLDIYAIGVPAIRWTRFSAEKPRREKAHSGLFQDPPFESFHL
jgi:hypothetical protein